MEGIRNEQPSVGTQDGACRLDTLVVESDNMDVGIVAGMVEVVAMGMCLKADMPADIRLVVGTSAETLGEMWGP